MTTAINTSAVTFYARMIPSELEAAVYKTAGRIAMEGCRHGRLCIAHAIREAVTVNAGPADSDHDYHREWRRMLPVAERLVCLAEAAYARRAA